MQEQFLKFSPGKANAKLQQIGGILYSMSLMSGWSCPFADKCYAKAVVDENGKAKVELGDKNEFKCFSASQEAFYPTVRQQRGHNFELLKKFKRAEEMAELIHNSLPKDATLIRVHVGGDFFSKEYMRAWFMAAKKNPHITFYAYTKSIGFWVVLKNEIPDNFKMNASVGGKQDKLIFEHNLKKVLVVYSEQEAIDKGLEIDHDDTHAFLKDKDFALLIHGNQPKGTKAAEARNLLMRAEKGQYSRTKIREQIKLQKAA